MGPPGSHRDNTPGAEWTSTEVLDCKMVGLRAAMTKSQEGSPDRHCKGVSKAGVLSSGTGNKGVSGLASRECQHDRRALTRRREHEGLRTGATGPSHKVLCQERWLGRRLFQHGFLILRVTAGGAELCLKNGIEDPPWRQHDEAIVEIA